MQKNTRQTLAAFGFLLPNFLGFLAFTCFPVLFSLAMAFTNWSAKPAIELEYRGIRNFERLLGFIPNNEAAPEIYAIKLP